MKFKVKDAHVFKTIFMPGNDANQQLDLPASRRRIGRRPISLAANTLREIAKKTLVLFLLIFCSLNLSAASIAIPGDVNAISFYTNFFYNLPADDFIYYLNDRLLFYEDPDDRLFPTGVRAQLDRVLQVHQRVKELMREVNNNDAETVTINLKTQEGVDKAGQLISLLGLYLEQDKQGRCQVYVDESTGVIDYYKFAALDTNALISQLNKTKLLHFKIINSSVAIPWDFAYLNKITGLNLDSASFFETMVKNERFSLLLATLYRLSEKERAFMDNINAWERIYQDKQLLMGMFVLSTALRSDGSRLVVPGGKAGEAFWSTLIGVDCVDFPLDFLEKLATMEDGKFNYLYVFSFFMPEEKRKVLFFDYNADRMLDILAYLHLNKEEKITMSALPRLRDFNFFTFLYSLRVEGGKIQVPGGIPAWMEVLKKKRDKEEGEQVPGPADLMIKLLEGSKKNGKNMSALQKFMSIYAKFYHRPGLLTPQALTALYDNYEEYNMLVDFIERIPLKKPATVLKLFQWLDAFGKVNKKDRGIYAAIFQSMLDIFSHAAKYAPQAYNYDRLVEKLIAIPMTGPIFCESMLDYFNKELKIRLNYDTIDRALQNFALIGVENRSIRLNNLAYRYLAKELYRDTIKEIQRSQEVCTMAGLLEIIDLLDGIIKYDTGRDPDIEERLHEAFLLLPHPDISEDAPKVIRERVITYTRPALDRDVDRLVKYLKSNTPKEKVKELIQKIKGEYLLTHLKDYLLSMVYALNAKSPKLRFFINPNLIRLHDFEGENGHTCWNFAGRPKSKVVQKRGAGLFGEGETETFTGYYLRGGLSRLNVVFATIWKDHLFGRNVIFDPDHVKAFIVNLLDFYPAPKLDRGQAYTALMVEFGLELLQKSKQNENLKKDLIKELATITTGYHYRTILEFLNGNSKDFYLFFSEIRNLGERFFQQKKYLKEFSAANKLAAFSKPSAALRADIDLFGSIYYNTFGSLKPYRMHLFPQEVSNFFDSGWAGGEMIDEFKVKVAYHAYKKDVPPYLLGELLFQYLDQTTRRYYSQNYEKDYFSTYFIFDIFNNSYLRKILKKAQEKGYLRIK